ncbi:response regulator transcription factor [Arachidicoccus terrestris]|uniref:response regulator transcription factor n=1 Tax=Arachidicoccus terrestris TaxID=2875539 RepID=UPI001CC461B8|nr:response regulator transcription factor [Arachidicoccus terrestris]UAY55991.1 response regulator transcription factor [Arachidicoccus terrestris]
MQVLLSAGSAESFMSDGGEELYFDIILSDIGLPGDSCMKGVTLMKIRRPKCQVMMLSVYNDTARIFQALYAGAAGYVSKQTAFVKIKEALNSIYNGGAFMSPNIAKKVTGYFNPAASSKVRDPLPQREQQVLHGVEEGLSNKIIAERFNISIEIVKAHGKKIYQKLEVNNRLDIVRGNTGKHCICPGYYSASFFSHSLSPVRGIFILSA